MVKKKELIYWVQRDGAWISVFITTSDLPKNDFGDIIGKIYNMRRRYSHKRIRLCWRNLEKKSVNEFKDYQMWSSRLENYMGPFPANWEY